MEWLKHALRKEINERKIVTWANQRHVENKRKIKHRLHWLYEFLGFMLCSFSSKSTDTRKSNFRTWVFLPFLFFCFTSSLVCLWFLCFWIHIFTHFCAMWMCNLDVYNFVFIFSCFCCSKLFISVAFGSCASPSSCSSVGWQGSLCVSHLISSLQSLPLFCSHTFRANFPVYVISYAHCFLHLFDCNNTQAQNIHPFRFII